MMYSTEEQKEDKQRRKEEGLVESNTVDLMEDKNENQWRLQDLGTMTYLHDLTCSNMSKRKEMSQDQVEVDSARLMTDDQEAGTRERSERDNSTEEFIIPDSLQSESSSNESQLHQETDLLTQASSKSSINKGMAH